MPTRPNPEYIVRGYSLFLRHLEYLDWLDGRDQDMSNVSRALRCVIDDHMHRNRKWREAEEAAE